MSHHTVKVLSDEHGNILAIESSSFITGSPPRFADDSIAPQAGQSLHEIEPPSQLAAHDVASLHKELLNYRILKEGTSARLART